jgi:hypothetical protein
LRRRIEGDDVLKARECPPSLAAALTAAQGIGPSTSLAATFNA